MSTGIVPTKSAPSQEVFGLNPHATYIIPESSDVSKHCLKATKELLEKDKVKAIIENGPSIKVQSKACLGITFE